MAVDHQERRRQLKAQMDDANKAEIAQEVLVDFFAVEEKRCEAAMLAEKPNEEMRQYWRAIRKLQEDIAQSILVGDEAARKYYE